MMALGADGAQIGTRFIATHECHAHAQFKEAILKATDTSTIATRRSKPPMVRSLRTRFTEDLREIDGSVPQRKTYGCTGSGQNLERLEWKGT